MTVSELENLDAPFITPAVAAKIIGCDPNKLRMAAHNQVNLGRDFLGFPVTVIGTRVKIPRIPFLQYIKREVAS